jgi:hypothetical protein
VYTLGVSEFTTNALDKTELLPDRLQEPVEAEVGLTRDHDRLAVALARHLVQRLHRDRVDLVVHCQGRDVLARAEEHVDELVDGDLVSTLRGVGH